MDKPEYSAEDIKALDWKEHVKMRPKLYFKECFDDKSLDALPFEAACHAFDEFLDGKTHNIEMGIAPDSFFIKYDAGMSMQITYNETFAETIMTKMGACSNHKKHLEVGHEFCQLGMATINAASAECRLVTVSGSQKGTFNFQEGNLTSKTIELSSETESTYIFFKPSIALFGDLQLISEGVAKRALEIMEQLKGLNISVKSI